MTAHCAVIHYQTAATLPTGEGELSATPLSRAELPPGARSKQSEAYRRKQGDDVGGHRGRTVPYRGAACFSALSAFSSSAHGMWPSSSAAKIIEKSTAAPCGAVFPPIPLSGGRRKFIFFHSPAPAGRENRHRSALPRCRRQAAFEEQQCYAPNRRPAQRVVRCKAHRKRQGEGVFTYVEPHLRSNTAAGGYLRRA